MANDVAVIFTGKFEQQLRRELERDLIERTSTLPPKRPLTELDRALPTGPAQDLAQVHKVVASLTSPRLKKGMKTMPPMELMKV